MESVKQDIPDTLWIGFGRKDAPIVQDKARFLKYFHSWMHPYKFRVKHVEFWPGFSWGTVKMEHAEARNILLKHVIDKPFRPDNEAGWVLNKFEKCSPIFENSPKKSPKKSISQSAVMASVSLAANAKKRSSVADNLLAANNGSKEKSKSKNSSGQRKSRSTTASPATGTKSPQVMDLDDIETRKVMHAFDLDEDDDSELRVKATISKVVTGVRVVEALTKKHGIYKLSINDIVGASKFKPNDLTGAEIVIVLGPLKKNQRRRDFLWAEVSEDWTGPPPEAAAGVVSDEVEEDEDATTPVPPPLIKEETLENALINLKKFYIWSMKDSDQAQRHISALLDEVANAETMQVKIAIISDHLTLASQSFTGMDVDEESVMEELISSTRCSSAFSDVKRVVSHVEYEKEGSSHSEYRRSDISVKEDTMEEKLKLMQDMLPTDNANDFNPRNILNLSDSPIPPKSRQESVEDGIEVKHRTHDKPKKDHVFDLPTSRQTIKANASSYTVESSSEIQIDMIYWQKMLHWLTVHHFDDHKEHAKDHAKWVVIVWELAGITPTNLKSEIICQQQTVTNFCTRLAEMLEAKKAKIPFWNNLSISNIIQATLCYLVSKSFPAESVPRCMSQLFSTVPYANHKTGSVYQMRGYVDKYISEEKGLLMSPKGYVLFNSYSIVGGRGGLSGGNAEAEEDQSLTVPIGTHVLFNAVKAEQAIEDGKRYKYYVATNVWIEPDYQIYYDDLAKQITALDTSAMAKVLHRANSNLSDEAILSMYEDGLSRMGKAQGRIDLKDLLVDKATMDSLQPLVDFLRTRLELRLEMASNMSLMYASMWARIGYDLEYLRDDFHTLDALGSRGCVMYHWEKLLLNFQLPNCLEMGHLVRETLAFLSTSTARNYGNVDLVDGKTLYQLAVKRTKVDRHHQLLKGNHDQGSLWVPQPFQRAKLLEAVLRPKSTFPEDDHLIQTDKAEDVANTHSSNCNGVIKPPQEIKVKPEGEQVLTFEANQDGSLDACLIDAIVKGTIAFKYRIKDNVWRIISKHGETFPAPPDGWADREYIPIKRHVTPPVADSPTKTPLTPTNSLAPTTPALHQQSSAITPDAVILEQIRQQFQNQMQLQEHFNNLVAQQQKVKSETREELLQRHGFR